MHDCISPFSLVSPATLAWQRGDRVAWSAGYWSFQAAYNQEVGSFQAGKTIEYAPVPGKLEKFNFSLSDIFFTPDFTTFLCQ